MADFPVQKTDEEWRKILTPEQYQILRDTRPSARELRAEHREARRHVRVRRLRPAALHQRHQVRVRYRLAQLHAPLPARSARRRTRYGMTRTEVALLAVRRPPRPRVPGRPPAHGQRYCINGAVLTFTPRQG